MRIFSHKIGKGKDRFLSALVFYRYIACWFNLSINVAVIKMGFYAGTAEISVTLVLGRRPTHLNQ